MLTSAVRVRSRRAGRGAWRAPLVSAVAVLGMAGGLSGCGAADAAKPQAESRSTATSDPARGQGADTDDPRIPEDVLLTAADLPWRLAEQPQPDDHMHLAFTASSCSDVDLSREVPIAATYLAPKARSFNGVLQHVGRDTEGYLNRLRQALLVCPVGKPLQRLTMVAADFAGDESYLVKDEEREYRTYYVVVREGEVYTEIRVSIDGATEEQVRGIGKTAAKRLCKAPDSC